MVGPTTFGRAFRRFRIAAILPIGALCLVTNLVAQPTSAHAGPIASAAGTTTTAGISGTVTGPGGSLLSGICVFAVSFSGGAPHSGSATTAANGTYSITGLAAGLYTVRFSKGCGNNGNYEVNFYNNATSEATATPVTVAAGQTVTAINAALALAATITGTVTAAAGGGALPGICVDASSSTGRPGVWSATTAADGTYGITGLPAGSYTVQFSSGPYCGNGNYATQYYNNATSEATATPVTVAAGQTARSINAAMALVGAHPGPGPRHPHRHRRHHPPGRRESDVQSDCDPAPAACPPPASGRWH